MRVGASMGHVPHAGHLRPEMSPPALVQGRLIRRRYGLLFASEALSIGIAWALCYGFGQPHYAFPATALLAGLHFFAVAPVFGLSFDYAVGALLCMLALGTLILVPAGGVIWTLNALVGLASVCLLWAGALQRLGRGMALL